jgi:magnesium chelatase family protein
MDDDEALASAALQGLAPGGFDTTRWRCRPVRSPHHSASAVALVGGGVGGRAFPELGLH